MPRTSGAKPRNERVALAVVNSDDKKGPGTVAKARTVLLSGTVRVEYDVSVPDGSEGKRDLHVRVEFPDEVRSMLESTTWGRGSSIFEAISGVGAQYIERQAAADLISTARSLPTGTQTLRLPISFVRSRLTSLLRASA